MQKKKKCTGELLINWLLGESPEQKPNGSQPGISLGKGRNVGEKAAKVARLLGLQPEYNAPIYTSFLVTQLVFTDEELAEEACIGKVSEKLLRFKGKID